MNIYIARFKHYTGFKLLFFLKEKNNRAFCCFFFLKKEKASCTECASMFTQTKHCMRTMNKVPRSSGNAIKHKVTRFQCWGRRCHCSPVRPCYWEKRLFWLVSQHTTLVLKQMNTLCFFFFVYMQAKKRSHLKKDSVCFGGGTRKILRRKINDLEPIRRSSPSLHLTFPRPHILEAPIAVGV